MTISQSYSKYPNLPRHQIELLIAHILQKDRLWVLSNGEYVLSKPQQKQLALYMTELIDNMPLAYIVGYKRFYDVDFVVNPHVLIPRQETEELIQHITNHYSSKRSTFNVQRSTLVFADIGTGSGCIGLTLSRLLPDHQFFLTDQSKHALSVAENNYQNHFKSSNIKFFQGDLLEPLMNVACYPDVIIANLPYISENLYAELPLSVAQYEPRAALDGGHDGLVLYRRLLEQLSAFYGDKTWPDLWFEISPEQKDLIPALFELYDNKPCIEYIKDLNERWRFVKVTAEVNVVH